MVFLVGKSSPRAKRLRGFQAERDLVKLLWKLGFAVIRAPASGSKVKRAIYPDVVAIRKGKVLVFEVKRRSELSTIYVPKEQVEKLKVFSERAGGEAFIAIKIPGRDWIFIELKDMEELDNKFRINKEVLSKGLTIYDIIKRMNISLGLDEYSRK